MFDRNSSEYATRESPSYGLLSGETASALSIGAVLFVTTVGAMIMFADTIIGELVLTAYNFHPLIGVAIIGLGLGLGRKYGMKGLIEDNTSVGLLGIGVTILTYGAFGGAVLTPYEPSSYVPAILVASAVTTVISLGAGAYVMSHDRSFEHWKRYSSYAFLFGIGGILVGSFIPGSIGSLLLIGGFVAFVVGFFADLVYEIWVMVSARRKPFVNGFALYIAFTGIFVHILQIALEAVSE